MKINRLLFGKYDNNLYNLYVVTKKKNIKMTQEILEIAEENRDEFLNLLYIYGKETWWGKLIQSAKNEEFEAFIDLWVELFLNNQQHFVCQEELYEIWNFYRGPFRTDENFTKIGEPSETFMKIEYSDFEKHIDENIGKHNTDKNI